jgi:hypothetical protein
MLGCPRARRTRYDDDIDLRADQLGSEAGKARDVAVRPSVLQNEVLSLDVAQLGHPLPERIDNAQHFRARRGLAEPSYPHNFVCLLRPGGERRGEETACQGADEGSPIHHSIT